MPSEAATLGHLHRGLVMASSPSIPSCIGSSPSIPYCIGDQILFQGRRPLTVVSELVPKAL
ncbi:hypothetical protein AMTR_s00155p00058390 [Amborella trichopoda]|uniref:Uncharacterized protein n=1 Tax=Amborella trichopoda TaxID=13333 RepID=W1PJ66_AMBTC|nr:hypothetical protein AMTR_s00155p00058390 [Amborella trichopoda]